MPNSGTDVPRRRPCSSRPAAERSFTLIETVIALSIITFLIIEVAKVQGNSIVFSDYGRNVTQATWLARRVLSQVEYFWQTKPFKELIHKVDGRKFDDYPEYSYSLEIKEWKFPLERLLAGGIMPSGAAEEKDEESESSQEGGMSQMIENGIKQVFGDEPKFLTAFVEVTWAEGAQKNSTSMTYLLTNQNKIDEFLPTFKQTYDQCMSAAKPNCQDPKNRSKPECANRCQPQPTDKCCTKDGEKFANCRQDDPTTWPPPDRQFQAP